MLSAGVGINSDWIIGARFGSDFIGSNIKSSRSDGKFGISDTGFTSESTITSDEVISLGLEAFYRKIRKLDSNTVNILHFALFSFRHFWWNLVSTNISTSSNASINMLIYRLRNELNQISLICWKVNFCHILKQPWYNTISFNMECCWKILYIF